jgi:DNA replication initiation complex subunit (GINS family)
MLAKYEQTIEEAMIKMQQMASSVMTEKELRDKLETYLSEMRETMFSAAQAVKAMREMLSNVMEIASTSGALTGAGAAAAGQAPPSGAEQAQQPAQPPGGQAQQPSGGQGGGA